MGVGIWDNPDTCSWQLGSWRKLVSHTKQSTNQIVVLESARERSERLLVIVDISTKTAWHSQFVTDLQRCVGSRITDWSIDARLGFCLFVWLFKLKDSNYHRIHHHSNTNLVGISLEFSGPNLKQANPGCSSGESTESPSLLIFLLLNLGPAIQSKTLRL